MLIHNERTKLTANALNTAATSCLTVGVAAPLAAALYGAASMNDRWISLIVIAAAWVAMAIALHTTARYHLGRLSN